MLTKHTISFLCPVDMNRRRIALYVVCELVVTEKRCPPITHFAVTLARLQSLSLSEIIAIMPI